MYSDRKTRIMMGLRSIWAIKRLWQQHTKDRGHKASLRANDLLNDLQQYDPPIFRQRLSTAPDTH